MLTDQLLTWNDDLAAQADADDLHTLLFDENQVNPDIPTNVTWEKSPDGNAFRIHGNNGFDYVIRPFRTWPPDEVRQYYLDTEPSGKTPDQKVVELIEKTFNMVVREIDVYVENKKSQGRGPHRVGLNKEFGIWVGFRIPQIRWECDSEYLREKEHTQGGSFRQGERFNADIHLKDSMLFFEPLKMGETEMTIITPAGRQKLTFKVEN